METMTMSVYARLVSFSSSMQTMQPTENAALQRGKKKEGEWLLSFPLSHFPGHELFNGFSHLCVWGDVICIHPTVTGTWGVEPMEQLLMCKHHINPSLPPPPPLSHSKQALMSHLPPKNMLLFHYINLVAPPLDMESMLPLTCSSVSLQPRNANVPSSSTSAHFDPLNQHLSEQLKDSKTALKLHKTGLQELNSVR